MNTGSSLFGHQFILRFHLNDEVEGEIIITSRFDKHLVLGRMTGDDQDYLDLTDLGGHEYGVSRMHARIVRYPMTLLVQDLGSTNGTFLNGFKLDTDRGLVLRDGDALALGNLEMWVEFVSDFPDEAPHTP